MPEKSRHLPRATVPAGARSRLIRELLQKYLETSRKVICSYIIATIYYPLYNLYVCHFSDHPALNQDVNLYSLTILPFGLLLFKK